MYMYTCICTCTHAHVHARVHTHTHTPSLSIFSSSSSRGAAVQLTGIPIQLLTNFFLTHFSLSLSLLFMWACPLQQNRYRVMNKDQWCNVLEFSRSILPDLSNYDEDGACESSLPSVMPLACCHMLTLTRGLAVTAASQSHYFIWQRVITFQQQQQNMLCRNCMADLFIEELGHVVLVGSVCLCVYVSAHACLCDCEWEVCLAVAIMFHKWTDWAVSVLYLFIP